MKLLAIEFGQALQLLLMDEVRPLRGATFLPDAIVTIAKRYRFADVPTDLTKISQENALRFQMGTIEIGGDTLNVGSLEIYTDGIVVNTGHTDDADRILDEFIEWVKTEFGYRDVVTRISRRHVSSIVVELQSPLDQIIGGISHLSSVISDAFGTEGMKLQSLGFSDDPLKEVGHRSWQIEPRARKPFLANRYFSTAGLRTSDHIAMLERLEALSAK